MTHVVIVVAMVWVTLLLAGGGLVLLRASGTLHRIVAFDLLSVLTIEFLALLSYLRDSSYYLDAALALGLLSLVGTLAAARRHAHGRPL